jgi:hypothetical protein
MQPQSVDDNCSLSQSLRLLHSIYDTVILMRNCPAVCKVWRLNLQIDNVNPQAGSSHMRETSIWWSWSIYKTKRSWKRREHMKLHDRILQIPANELVHSRGRSSNGVVALWVLIMSLLARQMYQIIKRKMVSFWSRKEWICKMVKAFEFHPPLGPINVEGSWNWNGTRHPLKVGKEKMNDCQSQLEDIESKNFEYW